MASEPSFQVFLYTGTPQQDLELAACAQAWQQMDHPFWPLTDTLVMLERQACRAYFVAASMEEAWCGVALVDVTSDVVDLHYLYVPAQQRRRGIASLLLDHLLHLGGDEAPGPAVVLEVRPSNLAALTLYQRLGFVAVGRRRGYYSNGEDALVLRHGGHPAQPIPAVTEGS